MNKLSTRKKGNALQLLRDRRSSSMLCTTRTISKCKCIVRYYSRNSRSTFFLVCFVFSEEQPAIHTYIHGKDDVLLKMSRSGTFSFITHPPARSTPACGCFQVMALQAVVAPCLVLCGVILSGSSALLATGACMRQTSRGGFCVRVCLVCVKRADCPHSDDEIWSSQPNGMHLSLCAWWPSSRRGGALFCCCCFSYALGAATKGRVYPLLASGAATRSS